MDAPQESLPRTEHSLDGVFKATLPSPGMDERIEIPSYWKENLRRSFKVWEGREFLIGLLVILATASGYGVYTNDPRLARVFAVAAVVYVGFLMLIQSPWQMWNDSQRRIGRYRESLQPKVRFVFEPDVPPYLQHFGLQTPHQPDRMVRLYRIGIRNESAAIIRKVRVVIESIEHTINGIAQVSSPDQPGLVEHALNVKGIDSKDGRVDLAPGDRPTAYFDVVEQMQVSGQLPEPYMSPCYATRHRTPVPVSRSRWVFRLRVEGGRTYRTAKVALEPGEDGRIVMKPISFD